MKVLTLFLLMLISDGLHAQDSLTVDDPIEETQTDEEFESDEELDFSDGETNGYQESHTYLKPADLRSTEQYKNEKIYHKTFDENTWRKVVGDETYEEDTPDPPKNLKLPSLPWGGVVLKAIGYTVIVGLVLFILFYVFNNIKINKKSKSGSMSPFARLDEEDIQEMDLPNLLKTALDERNFRLAVRYYFLILLKNLHDGGMIKWEKDKTNREYLSELFAKDKYYNEVRKLTRSYEEVWFSDHQFADESLLSLIEKFKSIESKLNTPKSL